MGSLLIKVCPHINKYVYIDNFYRDYLHWHISRRKEKDSTKVTKTSFRAINFNKRASVYCTTKFKLLDFKFMYTEI